MTLGELMRARSPEAMARDAAARIEGAILAEGNLVHRLARAADARDAARIAAGHVCCRCGAASTMFASLGQSCDDCYDALSN